MTITFKSGDLFEDDAEALVNTVNCVGVMGKGVALQVKNRWPMNYHLYHEACERSEVRPGQMLTYQVDNRLTGDATKYVINFPTKVHWKAKSKIEYIESGLPSLAEEIERLKIKSIAIPPLGCGNGGLDWSIVRPLIVSVLSRLLDVDIRIYGPANESSDPEYAPLSIKMTDGRAILVAALSYFESSSNGYVDRTSVHKIAYLLTLLGAPINIKFSIYENTPYSTKFAQSLTSLIKKKLLSKANKSNRNHSAVSVTRSGLALAQEHLNKHPSSEAIFEKLKTSSEGFMSKEKLALLSRTLAYLDTNQMNLDSIEEINEKIKEWKLMDSKRYADADYVNVINRAKNIWLDSASIKQDPRNSNPTDRLK